MVQHDETQPAGGQQDEQSTAPHAQTVQLISGEYLLTINPVDGSEVESCPPGRRPVRPRKFSTDERPGPRHPEHSLTGVPVPPVPAAAVLLEREEERETLTRMLTHGRSVRLTGAPGTGRSALLDAVAEDVETVAPDGVVRLSGHRRTIDELLRALFTATHDSPYVRPESSRMLEALATVGAVVLVDDVELSPAELDQLLEAAPECAFLVTATPEAAATDVSSRFTETRLTGLSRTGCAELLEHAVQRQLTEEETDWVGDLWFESEGRPLRFVQAGALLRQRDTNRTDQPSGTPPEALPPGVHQGNVPGLVARLAGGLPGSAQETLCLAVALDGELPHPTSLSALAEDGGAVEEFAQLAASGLVSTVGGRMMLAFGALDELTAAGYGVGAALRVTSAAQHYGWWVNHSSVSGPRASAEAEAVLAALRGAQRGEQASTAVLLARAAAPVFAGALRWGAWESAVRTGQKAARMTGQVEEEAYFRHELGVHALCTGDLERARVELEASIALRGAFTDRSGTVAGRRALALVSDRAAAADTGSGGAAPGPRGDGAAPESTPNAPTPRVTPVAPPPPAESHSKAEPPQVAERPAEQPSPPEGSPASGDPVGHRPPSERHRFGAGEAYAGAEPPYGPASEADPYGPSPVLPLGAGAGAGELSVDGEPETLVSRNAGARRENTSPPRRLAALGTRRNMVAVGAGALLAAVLGTVFTIGSTSSSSDDRSPADTVQPEESSPRESDSTLPSEEVSERPDSPRPTSEPTSEPPEPAPGTSEQTSPPESSDGPSSSSPEDPSTTPEDPTTSPEDPSTTPEDPTTSPEDPEPSSSPEESFSRESSMPRPGTDSPAATLSEE